MSNFAAVIFKKDYAAYIIIPVILVCLFFVFLYRSRRGSICRVGS